MTTVALPGRFASKVNFTGGGGCWTWQASLFFNGYGQYYLDGQMRRAHRYAYECLVGPIPRGMVVDHTCFNRSCVNPMHLRLVTGKQNQEHRLGAQRNSTTGVRGVSFIPGTGKYVARARHNGRMFSGGTHASLADAEAAAIQLRARLFTHDDARHEDA